MSASIPPTLSRDRSIKVLKDLEQKRKQINKKKNATRINEFKMELSGIFPMIKNVNDVPVAEREFYQDQCNNRKQVISSSIDKTQTLKNTRKIKDQQRLRKTNAQDQTEVELCPSSDQSVASDSDMVDPEFKIVEPEPKKTKYFTGKLPDVVHALAQTNATDRAASKIATAVCQNLGANIVITRKKIRSQRENVRHEETEKLKGISMNGLYYDGHNDRETTTIDDEGRVTTIAKSHYTVVSEPSGTYCGFFTPRDGTGREVGHSVLGHCNDYCLDTQDTLVLGTDGTNSNTGWKDGSMTHIEVALNRPMQRVVCLLHHIELPFRKLFEQLDGTTSGPNSFTGPIGKRAAKEVWLLPTNADFRPIQNDDFPQLPSNVEVNLSTDAKYLHEVCKVITSGEVSDKAIKNMIGKLCHSRWLTLASRIARMYISIDSEDPAYENVLLLTRYVVTVYWPMHISIKHQSSILDGPQLLFKEIQLVKSLNYSDFLQGILFKNIQQNAFFAHPENMLLAMLGDKNKQIRSKAVKMIKKVQRNGNDNGIRQFHLPKLDMDAPSYDKLISISEFGRSEIIFLSNLKGNLPVTAPPLLQNCTDISQFVTVPLAVYYPNHTQSVERGVKLTTESTSRICGQKRQIGEALCKIAATKKPWIGKNNEVSKKAFEENH